MWNAKGEGPSGPYFYYQGFHDFVSVFYLTLGENLGFYCADAASKYFIRDFMLESFEPGVIPILKVLIKILEVCDEECYEIVSIMGDMPTFVLSWLLTWYSHVITEFRTV